MCRIYFETKFGRARPSLGIADADRGAADGAAAFGEFGVAEQDGLETVSFDGPLELGCALVHDNRFTGGNEIAGVGFGSFAQTDFDFIDAVERVEELLAFGHERIGTPGDEAFLGFERWL